MTRMIAVISGKGGVGKSTVAANIAYMLRQKGKTVGLLDLDLDGSNIPKIIGLDLSEPVIAVNAVKPIEFHGVKIMSMAQVVLNDDIPVLLRGERKRRLVDDFLRNVDWGEDLDYLIFDLPPAAGDTAISILEHYGEKLHGVVIVGTPSRVAVTDVRKTATLCGQYGLRIIALVNNMAHFSCPKCTEKINVFGAGNEVDKAVADFNIRTIVNMPIHQDIECNPFLMSLELGPVVEAIMKWRLF